MTPAERQSPIFRRLDALIAAGLGDVPQVEISPSQERAAMAPRKRGSGPGRPRGHHNEPRDWQAQRAACGAPRHPDRSRLPVPRLQPRMVIESVAPGRCLWHDEIVSALGLITRSRGLGWGLDHSPVCQLTRTVRSENWHTAYVIGIGISKIPPAESSSGSNGSQFRTKWTARDTLPWLTTRMLLRTSELGTR